MQTLFVGSNDHDALNVLIRKVILRGLLKNDSLL